MGDGLLWERVHREGPARPLFNQACVDEIRDRLRQSEAEVERLRAELNVTIDDAIDREIRLAHQVEELERDVVWAVRNDAAAGDVCLVWGDGPPFRDRTIEYDGTDAGLLAAARRGRVGDADR